MKLIWGETWFPEFLFFWKLLKTAAAENTQLTWLLSVSQARQTLKTNRMEKLEKRVKLAIEKTLAAPQVQKLEEVRCLFSCRVCEIEVDTKSCI